MSVQLIAESTTQMGVAIKMQGKEYWFAYLDQQQADAVIDDKQRAEWEKKYDGYEMVWTFTNPVVSPLDKNIDAACMIGVK